MVLARLNLVSRERLSAMKRRVGFVLLALALLVLGEWAGEDLVERPRLLLVLDSPVPLLGAAGLLIVWCALEVRQALEAYRIAHGRYPPSLAALDRPSLPGNRLLHGDLLSYESDGSSYRLRFRDWLYDYQATDDSAFMAHK